MTNMPTNFFSFFFQMLRILHTHDLENPSLLILNETK